MKLQLPSATVKTSFRFAITKQQSQQSQHQQSLLQHHPNTNLAVSTFGFNCKRVKVVGVGAHSAAVDWHYKIYIRQDYVLDLT